MKNKLTILALLLGVAFVCSMCTDEEPNVDPDPNTGMEEMEEYVPPSGTSVLPETEQRQGDSVKGYDYLVNGDYLSSGIPFDIYKQLFGDDDANVLGREGENAKIDPTYTSVIAPNGVSIVAPNCMQCHGAFLNGEFIVGLGNHSGNFTIDISPVTNILDNLIDQRYGLESPEFDAYENFKLGTIALGEKIVTEVRGVNPADKIGAVLAAHRDLNTLEWNDEPSIELPNETIATDVPPWWSMQKKNVMFYAGNGRGDFPRYLMASVLLTMSDSTKANEVDELFPDVLAYINSIEPPNYPYPIDDELAEEGKAIFGTHCESCHGTYGENEFYPDLLVELDRVGTDRVLSDAYYETNTVYSRFIDWFNNGWFGHDPNGAFLETEGGYVAQPLDGIWASAPYLHNGSVPTLEDLLNSSQRPTYWSRTFEDDDYNTEKVGWNYTEETEKINANTYDATLYSYGNQGHTFGDILAPEDRSALLEYLKTL